MSSFEFTYSPTGLFNIREDVPREASVTDTADAQAAYDALLAIPCYHLAGGCPSDCGTYNLTFTYCDDTTVDAVVEVCGCSYVHVSGACEGSTWMDRTFLNVLADALGVESPM